MHCLFFVYACYLNVAVTNQKALAALVNAHIYFLFNVIFVSVFLLLILCNVYLYIITQVILAF